MDEVFTIDSEENKKRLYTERAISIGTFVGGPLAGAILFAQNFKALGMPIAARTSIFVGVGGLVLLFTILFSLPQKFVEAIPNAIYPVIWGAIAYLLVEKYQKRHIEGHIAGGGKKRSGWAVLGISIGGLALTVLVMVPFALAEPAFEGKAVTSVNTKCEVYYDDEVTAREAELLGEYFEVSGLSSAGDCLPAKLEKEGNGFNVLLEIQEEFWQDPELAELFENIMQDLENVFGVEVRILAVSYELDGKIKRRSFTRSVENDGA